MVKEYEENITENLSSKGVSLFLIHMYCYLYLYKCHLYLLNYCGAEIEIHYDCDRFYISDNKIRSEIP